jgi:hypothetical protein
MGKAGGTTIGDPPSRKSRAQDPPPRMNGVRAISDLVGKAGGAAFRRFGFVQHSIVARWPEIVGPRYAAVTAPESIRFPPGKKSQGVLTLVVEGAHAPMLQHVLPALVERVNRFFGYSAVERVAMKQGRVAPPAAPPVKAAPAPPISADLGESLREIGDPELRAVLESLACSLSSGDGTRHVTAIPVVGTIGDTRR